MMFALDELKGNTQQPLEWHRSATEAMIYIWTLAGYINCLKLFSKQALLEWVFICFVEKWNIC